MSCDHDFSLPLRAQAPSGEWLSVIVGWACSKCFWQLFDGDPPLTWTAATNVTEHLTVVRP